MTRMAISPRIDRSISQVMSSVAHSYPTQCPMNGNA